MYSNLISFVAAILLYELYVPGLRLGSWSLGEVISGSLVVVVAYYGLVRWAFVRLARRFRSGSLGVQTLVLFQSSLLQRFTVVAVFLYAAILYVLRWKDMCVTLVGGDGPQSLSSIIGLGPFFLLLLAQWAASYVPLRGLGEGTTDTGHVHGVILGVRRYISSQARFNMAILVPWIVASAVVDLLAIISASAVKHIQEDVIWAMVAFGIFLLALAWVFPVVAIKLWGCRPLPEGPRERKLRAFFSRHGFRYSRIVLWDLFPGPWPTAGILGVFPSSRYVLVTPGLLRALDDRELEAVMAHEMGHARYLHMPFYLLFMLGLTLLFDLCLHGTTWLLTLAALAMELKGWPLGAWLAGGQNGPVVVSLVVTVPSLAVVVFYLRFGFGLFSRNFERQSDIHALELQGTSEAIISSLEKVSGSSPIARVLPNWHHFSIQERIDFLRSCEGQPELMARHHRKVRLMVLCYLASLVILGFLTISWRKYQWGESWTLSLTQSVIERRLKEAPNDPRLWFELGTVAFRRGDMSTAEKGFRRCISIDPRNVEALNNLAWLYATSPDGEFRRPHEALHLALEAHRLSPHSPHILDTLAEAYFVNGLYEEAVDAELRALAYATDRRAYYRSQLDRFRKALPTLP